MKHSEFTMHCVFLFQGSEYVCTDVGQRTVLAVLFSDVREDWWLDSPPYPGAMPEHIFDENLLASCQPKHKSAIPPPTQTPPKPAAKETAPPPALTPASPPLLPSPLLFLIVLATTFCVLGIGSLLYCVTSSLHTRAFLARAVRVNATVTSVEESTDTKQHHRYTPTFTFTDATGKSWVNSSGQTEDAPRRVGEAVAVLYDPQNPAEARIESFENAWGTPLASGLGGLLMLGAGAAVGKHFSNLLRRASGGGR